MKVLSFPTETERVLRAIRKSLDQSLSVLGEPASSEVVEEVMRIAAAYMPDDNLLLYLSEPLTQDQEKSLQQGVEVMMSGVAKKFAGLLGEVIRLRVDKAVSEMMPVEL